VKTTTIAANKLQTLTSDIFSAIGSSKAEADRIAHYLLGANLAGHDSHGVIRIPRYVQMKLDGLLVADQKVTVLVDTPVLALVDAKRGFGQTVGPQAVQMGIDKCKAMGLSAVSLRNSGHLGRIGDWAAMAADAGLVSIHFVNGAGSVFVAPHGSVERRFSTAPYCVGVPLPGRPPLLLDFATSLVAEGKVLVASQGGTAIPADALIGPDGQTSNDTRLIYGDFPVTGKRDFRQGKGAIRAFGEHKGSGLALMCELLGGALTGNGCSSREGPFANGMLSIYLDPTKMDPEMLFPEEAARYVAHIKSAKPAQPGGDTLVPGEPEERSKKKRLAEGIPLAEETWQSILATAKLVGVNYKTHSA
jgi:hydroxycarboxylate dehydrogenase B